ncbi:hypothetical protein CHUAL_001003 [Chamberlinius hualienensis]
MDENREVSSMEMTEASMDNCSQMTIARPSHKIGCCRWRYAIAFLGFLAMTNSYSLRTLLSVSIVAMVDTDKNNHNNTNSTFSVCGKSSAAIHHTTGHTTEFDWDQKLQGVINGAFYYGYIIPQIAGGRLAERYSAKWVIFVGGVIGTFATLIGPIAARINVGFFIFTRILCGLGLSVFQPSLHSLIARWAPPHERSIFSAIIYSGNQFGAVIALLAAGVIDEYASDGGWPWSFYVFGIVAVVWLILWVIFVYKTPDEHPWISLAEKEYIQHCLRSTMTAKHGLAVPWKRIFSSKSFWALILCHFGYNWGFYTLLQQIPTYMNDILGFSLAANGLLSSLPYLMMMLTGYLSSYIAFQLTKRQILRVVTVRKGLNTIAFYGSALSLLIITFLNCQTSVIYGMLMLAVILFGLTYAGFQINHVDLSPNYAGTLEGITNSAASIPGIISPYIVGILTENNETEEAWRIIFYISMSILFVFGTFYLIVGSANLKLWNELENNPENDDDNSGSPKCVSFRRLC